MVVEYREACTLNQFILGQHVGVLHVSALSQEAASGFALGRGTFGGADHAAAVVLRDAAS